jgi:hypothetical protein
VRERSNHHSDDVAEFVAATSLLGSAVPRVFASLAMPSIVMTGRLCCLRWVTGEDCVRPWCGPLAAATPTGVDEPEKKPRLPPAENGEGRPTVCERPCVGLRGGRGALRGPSEAPISDSLDLAAGTLTDAVEPLILASTTGSAPRASGGTGAGAGASQEGAWIESAKLRPGWLESMGGVIEEVGTGTGGSEVVGRWGGVSLEGSVFKTGACSGGREGSRGSGLVGGETGPD